MWSRYAASTFLLPDPAEHAEAFAESVGREALGRGAICVLCGTDAAAWALSRWRDLLPVSARRLIAPHEAIARVLDRATLHDLARSLGITCTDTLRVDAREQVEPALRRAKALGLPALVRSLVPWEERGDGTRRLAQTIRVRNIAELRRLLYEREDLVDGGCLIEPRPPAQSLGYGVVCDGGEPLVEVFVEHMRESEALSGVSTHGRTLPLDTEVRALGRKLLGALNWQGPAMIQFIRTRDGVLHLASMVGRLWLSVQLAINAGIDVPYLCYRLAEGARIPQGRIAKPGVEFRWAVGDAQALFSEARGASGQMSLAERASAMRELLHPRGLMNVGTDVVDSSDPMPFVFEVQDWVQALRRVSSGRRRRR